MAMEQKWCFTKEYLSDLPSQKSGISNEMELHCRQICAKCIQDIGEKLSIKQSCINTAITFMHRFYVHHSFQLFHRDGMGPASLLLATKIEGHAVSIDDIIMLAYSEHLQTKSPEINNKHYERLRDDMIFNESTLIQTLGFDFNVIHPHFHVIEYCNIFKVNSDVAKIANLTATNSLHLTTMCLQYSPKVIAGFCFYLACKWSGTEIPLSTENKKWWLYIDESITEELLEKLTDEFLNVYDKTNSCMKIETEKLLTESENAKKNSPKTPDSGYQSPLMDNNPQENRKRKRE